ncbi:MAG: hypothetical protein HRT35_17930 [Algicola sp.]|nr:hypothetical protein [Algicola sp.]
MIQSRTTASAGIKQSVDTTVSKAEKPMVEECVKVVNGPYVMEVVKHGHLRTLKWKTKVQLFTPLWTGYWSVKSQLEMLIEI